MAAISSRARQGLQQFAEAAMRAALLPPGGSAVIESVDAEAPAQERMVVMLTVSSYAFRLSFFVHFEERPETLDYFARLHHVDPGQFSRQAFLDAVSECGNLCCGTFNREIGRVYPHVGMSTPHRLESECLQHLSLLDPDWRLRLRLHPEDGPPFHVTLAVSAYEAIDFDPPAPETEVASGELELL